MRLGRDVLLEIISIVQDGISTGTDVSHLLRELDVSVSGPSQDEVELSHSYKEKRGRA